VIITVKPQETCGITLGRLVTVKFASYPITGAGVVFVNVMSKVIPPVFPFTYTVPLEGLIP
jgi:hypothetical protein